METVQSYRAYRQQVVQVRAVPAGVDSGCRFVLAVVKLASLAARVEWEETALKTNETHLLDFHKFHCLAVDVRAALADGPQSLGLWAGSWQRGMASPSRNREIRGSRDGWQIEACRHQKVNSRLHIQLLMERESADMRWRRCSQSAGSK